MKELEFLKKITKELSKDDLEYLYHLCTNTPIEFMRMVGSIVSEKENENE